jgi:DNA primase
MQTVFDLAYADTRLHRVAVNEYAGPCPGCGGEDRFHVNLRKREHGSWMCRYCWPAESKGWGDEIEYLRRFRGLSFSEAKAYLAGEVDTGLSRVQKLRGQRDPETQQPYGRPPTIRNFQERAEHYAGEAYHRLWAPDGQAGLAYLHSRGFTNETIRKAHVGFDPARKNPKTGKIVPCIVIPWYADGAYWRITFRDIRPDVPRDERYFTAYGSTNAGLYAGDALKFTRPVFLVEDEFSVLTIAQEAGDLVTAVATGTTTGSRTMKWVARLARALAVLVAYDRDEDGDRASQEFWLNVLEHNTLRWRPILKDANDMLRQGYNVREWVTAALDYLSEDDKGKPEPSATPANEPVEPVEHTNGKEPVRVVRGHVQKREKMPSWYIEGTPDYKAFVKKHGLAEVHERRAIWFAQQQQGNDAVREVS